MRRLFDAIQDGASSRVRAILDERPEAIEALGDGNEMRLDKTPLMWALQCNKLGLAKMLVERGADVRARMPAGPRSSVLGLAVRFVIADRDPAPNLRIIETLIDAGADPNDGLWPALHAYHQKFDRTEIIELLLQRGADPDLLAGNSGSTVRELVRINAKRYSDRALALFGIERDPVADST